MRRFSFAVTLLITLFPFTTFSQIKGDSWAAVQSKGSGTLAIIYSEQAGLIFKDKDGKIKGVCVDIINDFAKHIKDKHGKSITVKYVREEPVFGTFLSTVQSTPDLVGITNTTITEERKKIFKFSPAYMSNRQVLLTHNSAPSLTSLKELPVKFSGFSAQVIAGSTQVQYVEKIKADHMPALRISHEQSGPAIIKNLSSNPRVFTVIDFTEFIHVVHHKLPIKRHAVDVGPVEELGFVLSRQSDWDPPLKDFLTSDYRNSSRYRQIITENLGATFLSLVK
ncbi:MAG TPA: transporter substrate-binding domain-containing protein [Ohtaekwangia sp.]|nr:transporter substrate-binding domain-containing protein [Ohtaekwangia sp.]